MELCIKLSADDLEKEDVRAALRLLGVHGHCVDEAAAEVEAPEVAEEAKPSRKPRQKKEAPPAMGADEILEIVRKFAAEHGKAEAVRLLNQYAPTMGDLKPEERANLAADIVAYQPSSELDI